MAKAGLAFSGGGVRSAALCSGVLRRLLQKNVSVDYLSCVSGGGYTGTAYLEWKYRHGKRDDKVWHQEFFDHMRKNVGLICNWQRPLRGILGCFAIITLVLFVTFLLPCLLWGSYAFPLAYAVDFVFGEIMRGGRCLEEARRNENTTAIGCEADGRNNPAVIDVKFLIVFLPINIAVLSYALRDLIPKAKGALTFLATVCIFLAGLTFFPILVEDFIRFLPFKMQLLVFVSVFLAWLKFPLSRKNATLLTVVYLYSYVISWRVYQSNNALNVEYDEDMFNVLLGISIILTGFTNLIGSIQQRLGHFYVRWIIQNAFYYPQTVGTCGCAGISWRNLFLRCPTFPKNVQFMTPQPVQALTLDDLDDFKPIYIGCATNNRWRRSTLPLDPQYEVLTLSPQGIERLDRLHEENHLNGKLLPTDVYLSDAAATSAAALDYHMGGMQGDDEPFRDLKVLLGLSLGASVVADKRREDNRHICRQVLPWIIDCFRVLPLVICFIFYVHTRQQLYLNIAVLTFYATILTLSLFALVPTGSNNPGRLERIARWFTINIPFVSYIRKTVNMVNEGPNPPPVLYLSDGGHIENLGILPLLKLRLKKIIAVDGGQVLLDRNYGRSLLDALELARLKLGCSFLGMDGRDVIEDIRDKFIDTTPGFQPSSYRFRVSYYEKKYNTDGKVKVGEGELLLITPRHPDKASAAINPNLTWQDIDLDLDAGTWGVGPTVSAEEADRLTFCCCECCHGNRCQGCSSFLCGAFPQHSTNNQFFTSSLFTAYHREGYRACMEANAEAFVGDDAQENITKPFVV